MASFTNSKVLTPVKAVKNQSEVIKQWDIAASDLYSKAVSRIRQPLNHCLTGSLKKQIFKEPQKCVLQKDCLFTLSAQK
jgi:vacuolar-type H+-ATPase subunit I/STV1